MTNVELWMNIAVILLLIPTVFYAALLSRRLKNATKPATDDRTCEALRHAADIYDAGEKTPRPIKPIRSRRLRKKTLPATPFSKHGRRRVLTNRILTNRRTTRNAAFYRAFISPLPTKSLPKPNLNFCRP